MAEGSQEINKIQGYSNIQYGRIGVTSGTGDYGLLDIYTDANNNGIRFAFSKNTGLIVVQTIENGNLVTKSYFNPLTQHDYVVTTTGSGGYVKVGNYSPTDRFINVFCKSNNIMALPFIGDNGSSLYVRLVDPFSLESVAIGTTATVCVVTI